MYGGESPDLGESHIFSSAPHGSIITRVSSPTDVGASLPRSWSTDTCEVYVEEYLRTSGFTQSFGTARFWEAASSAMYTPVTKTKGEVHYKAERLDRTRKRQVNATARLDT